jgi:hypothetical protein
MGSVYPTTTGASWPDYGSEQQRELERLRQENDHLRAHAERLEAITCLGSGLGEIAEMAKRYLPPEHHQTALQLLRLAHCRGYCERAEMETPARVVVLPVPLVEALTRSLGREG